MINSNIIKDKNNGYKFPHINIKKEMNIEYNGILNDFTQNLNNLNNDISINNKNKMNICRPINNAFNQISQETNTLMNSNNGIQNNSNLKINVNLII